MNAQPPAPSRPNSAFAPYAILLKVAAIAVLILILLIPLQMIRSVLRERLGRRNEAVAEIQSSWGAEQVVMGPVLIVPYLYAHKAWKDRVVDGRTERVEVVESVRGRAFFLPKTLKIDGQMDPLRLHRGIYETVVYAGQIELTGQFARPSFEEAKIENQEVLWDDAELAVSVTDLRGTKESLKVRLGGQTVPLEPGSRLEGFTGGVIARVTGLDELEALDFGMTLTFNGSRSLRLAPVGVDNEVRLESTWPDPSFQGAFLPTERETRPDGFRARWQVSYYGRGYPQAWTDRQPVGPSQVSASLFGVDLVSLVDGYRLTERAIKYGVLFIVLIFTAFFLFEVRAAARIHPFQYTLVGLALCLFYLVLLALSEFLRFGLAYWVGGLVSVLMVSLYSATALGLRGRGWVVAAGLGLTYGFLFVILRLQDYALLVGTAGLALVLGAVMWVTRSIDWYGRREATAAGITEPPALER